MFIRKQIQCTFKATPTITLVNRNHHAQYTVASALVTMV